jgi:hypothetical protein
MDYMACADQFKGPFTLEVRSVIHAMNSDLVVISGGVISCLFVLVNKAFQNHLKQLYYEGLPAEDHVLIPPEQYRGPERNCCASRSRSLQLILPEVIVKDLKSAVYLMK